MSLVVGFDVGTQGTKGIVVDVNTTEVVARASASYGLIEGLPPGHAEQDPRTWVGAVREVGRALFRAASLDPERVIGIGVSGQQHGLVMLDEMGEPIRPAKLWCDTSTEVESRELSDYFGRLVPTGYTAPKILWMRRHEPDNWARTRWVLLPHDYINYVLTGDMTMEAGDASGTGFFDPRTRSFQADEMRVIDPHLADRLPPLFSPGAQAGVLSDEGAALLALPAGIPVSAGGGDNMLSAVGSGATRPGVVTVSLGTSGTVFTHAERAIVDPEGLIAPFCASVGGWLPLLCVMNLTGVSEEVVRIFGRNHDELTALASFVELGSDGLIWLPFLQGERVPDLPLATGSLHGLRAGNLSAGSLYRAALEGTCMNIAWGVERMRMQGVALREARLVGGAAKNPLWRSIMTDCLGCPTATLREPESAALGAALQALWTVRVSEGDRSSADAVAFPYVKMDGKTLEPNPSRMERYRDLGEEFRSLVGKVHGI